jgi:hypothetical protein
VKPRQFVFIRVKYDGITLYYCDAAYFEHAGEVGFPLVDGFRRFMGEDHRWMIVPHHLKDGAHSNAALDGCKAHGSVPSFLE